MYFSAVGQTDNHAWSKGRVALIGDAAFCNGTFGGAGTSLALIGAYILAGELATTSDIPLALTRYQSLMQPFVRTAPRVRAEVLRLANPRSKAAIRILHAAAGLAAGPVGKAVGGLTGRALSTIGGDDTQLPDYPSNTLAW